MQVPERINDVQIYAHHGFMKSLKYCDKTYGLKNQNDFTTCIKAAGANFRQAFSQWEGFKYFLIYRSQQQMTHK